MPTERVRPHELDCVIANGFYSRGSFASPCCRSRQSHRTNLPRRATIAESATAQGAVRIAGRYADTRISSAAAPGPRHPTATDGACCGVYEGRIEEINDIIARAEVIDITKIANDGKVIFGSTVYLTNLDTGEKINYKIVGKDQADLKKKLIYFQSPIGKGLIGKNKNDLIEISTPSGTKNFEIKDVKVCFWFYTLK